MRKPSPALEAINSAATSGINADAKAIAHADDDVGHGRTQNHVVKKICMRPAPSVCAARMMDGSTCCTPPKTLITIRKKAAHAMIKILDDSPMPNHRMLSGIMAMGGTDRKTSMSGSMALRTGKDPGPGPWAAPAKRDEKTEQHAL